MNDLKPLHPDFERLLRGYDEQLVALYKELRNQLLELAPHCNELLYNSHALTIAFSLSGKLKDAFCHLPIYQNHINLGFNQGASLQDKQGVLQGTGKAIRHIKMNKLEDLDPYVIDLVQQAIALSQANAVTSTEHGISISHLKC